MAIHVYQPRFDDRWVIYADSESDLSNAEGAPAPVGSTIVYPDDAGSTIEYTLFPSGWVQTGGASNSEPPPQ